MNIKTDQESSIMDEADPEENHKQVPIKHEGEVVFSVDEKLQCLMQFLWDIGIETFNSCEDNVRGTTWIQYALDDWMVINEIAFRSEARELREFIEEECEVLLLSREDGYLDENDEYYIESDALIWTASVRFPKEYLLEFEQYMRAAVEALNVDLH